MYQLEDRLFLYNLNYSEYEEALCAIEFRALFNEELKEKILFSSIEVDPSVSPFIKNRFEILYETSTFEDLLAFVDEYKNDARDFDIKYLKLLSGDPLAEKRNTLCKIVGERMKHPRNFKSPETLYSITYYQDKWYFGVLIKNSYEWREHNNRPHTYSNSLNIHLAKVLINLAGMGDLTKSIIDPCCGAGTVVLEGCFAGYNIAGSDISRKTSWNALRNLRHFGYNASIRHQAIEDIEEHYDSSIIDLPYGLYSQTTPEAQAMIIRNAKRISDRIVIVSSEDIRDMIVKEDLKVVDSCKLIKTVNREFARYVWVCESESSV